MGLPVILTDIAAHRSIVAEASGVAFWAHPSAAGLAKAVTQVIAAESDALRRMGEAARQLAESRYTWQTQAQSLRNYLECRPLPRPLPSMRDVVAALSS